MLPPSFISSIRQVPGFNETTFLQVHQSGQQITSIRLNPAKPVPAAVLFNRQQLEPVPWSVNGYYLESRPSFTADPLFHAGAYYVQEASSMFLCTALQQLADLSKPLKVLDLCAAPGGKSTLLQSMINAQSVLVSNEVIKSRVSILAENISKWGTANVIVTNNDAADFKRLEGFFDIVVVDAPCSGSGLFRKDPSAVNEWSEANVALCSQRQQRIVQDVLPALKQGGLLLYSTCSYSAEEDEAIADWLVESCGLVSCAVSVNESWGIVPTASPVHVAHGYRFYPDQLKGEGFFFAAFQKQGEEHESGAVKKMRSEKVSTAEASILSTYIRPGEDVSFIKQQESIIAIPASVAVCLGELQSALYIRKAGVCMGTLIRNELVPDHELAVSVLLNPALPQLALDEAAALQYLRRQDFFVDSSIKGWAIVTYQQQPLGWVKLLPNRINNYYPKEWRILNK